MYWIKVFISSALIWKLIWNSIILLISRNVQFVQWLSDSMTYKSILSLKGSCMRLSLMRFSSILIWLMKKSMRTRMYIVLKQNEEIVGHSVHIEWIRLWFFVECPEKDKGTRSDWNSRFQFRFWRGSFSLPFELFIASTESSINDEFLCYKIQFDDSELIAASQTSQSTDYLS